MNLSINFYLTETNTLAKLDNMREAGQGMVLGIQTIEMGVLGVSSSVLLFIFYISVFIQFSYQMHLPSLVDRVSFL